MPIVPVITTGWSSAAQPAVVHPAVAFRNMEEATLVGGRNLVSCWSSVEGTPVIRIRHAFWKIPVSALGRALGRDGPRADQARQA